MQLKNRHYVYKVYLTRSFSKAAEQLFISQPALSALIKKEEAEIGTPIFNRSSTPISLTPAGEYYIKSIEKIMLIEQDMQDYFEPLAGKQTEVINIGSSTFFCAYILPSIIQKLQASYPHYQVNMMEASATDLQRCLKLGTIHFSLSTELPSPDEFINLTLGTECLILGVPIEYEVNQKLKDYALTFTDIVEKKHLQPDIPAVSITEFKNESFLLLKRGNDLYKRAFKICENAGFTPKVLLYLDQMFTAYQIAKEQKGITFLRSELIYHVEANNRLLYYKIDDPLTNRGINISYKKSHQLNTACQNLLTLLNEMEHPIIFR